MLPELPEVKKRRQAQGLTQSQLARACGLSQSLLAKIETGRTHPSYENACRIFNYLDSMALEKGAAAQAIMTANVVFVKESDLVSQAVKILNRRGISQVPVVSGKTAVGSFSEEAVSSLVASGFGPKKINSTKVASVMEPAFPQIPPQTPVSSVAALLAHEKAVLVVHGGAFRGIITKADLLKILK